MQCNVAADTCGEGGEGTHVIRPNQLWQEGVKAGVYGFHPFLVIGTVAGVKEACSAGVSSLQADDRSGAVHLYAHVQTPHC